uniref:Transposase n=1 Tax=Ditylenchus dipsaci TaxID=166011 RepID=A0A915D563_9BILA
MGMQAKEALVDKKGCRLFSMDLIFHNGSKIKNLGFVWNMFHKACNKTFCASKHTTLNSRFELRFNMVRPFFVLQEKRFHPYKMQHRQQINCLSQVKRVQHAEAQMRMIENDGAFLSNLLFSDESHFHLHGHVIHHCFRYHCFRRQPALVTRRATLFAEIFCMCRHWDAGIVGLIFVDGNITGKDHY